jgi:hypothetical protein
MDEQSWLVSSPPTRMLKHVQGAASERKLRLLLCACCHLSWSTVPTVSDWKSVVRTVEDYCEGMKGPDDLARVKSSMWEHWHAESEKRTLLDSLRTHGSDLRPSQLANLVTSTTYPIHMLRKLAMSSAWHSATTLVGDDLALLLRDIFGNPFRPVTFDPAWRTDTTTGLAAAMYEAREFANMPILADALEEAGCDHADILAHCRDETATHVRGCWVVDLVLGKE